MGDGERILITGVLLALGLVASLAAGRLRLPGLVLDLEPRYALLLGSTVAATDAAAVFAVLRGSTLKRRLARALEGESGINDPIAIVLVLGCIASIQDPSWGVVDAIVLTVRSL